MTDKEKIHQILSSLWKNDDSVGKMCYNQALQDVQTAIDLQEEPVNEDLEEAADFYIKTHGEITGFGRQTFKAGAKWKEQQMMAKAVEGGCFSKNGFVHISCDVDECITNIKFGDKVKIIVIKEEQL